jgi:phosphate transport system permease protein
MDTPRPEVARRGLQRRAAGPGRVAANQIHPGGDPSSLRGRSLIGERVFHGLAVAAGSTVIAAVALIAIFLLVQAVPSVLADRANFLTSAAFSTADAGNLRFGIRDLLVVTVLSSAFALVIAVPVSIGIALFLTQYAPKRIASFLAAVVDLLAAVPSIVYGLWGILILAPFIEPVAVFLNRTLGWFPLLATGNVSISGGGTIFTAGVVLAVMIIPIITSVARESYRQTPVPHIEAAQGLGATKWEVIRVAVLPYGRSGMVAGAMLGLGRALGETVAVLIILRSAQAASHASLFDGGYTFASKIASAAAEFSEPLPTGAYIAAGFVLFLLTFLVNAIARFVVRGKANR